MVKAILITLTCILSIILNICTIETEGQYYIFI